MGKAKAARSPKTSRTKRIRTAGDSVKFLREFASELRARIHADARQPTRAELRRHLGRLTRALLLARNAINVPIIRAHLEFFGPIENRSNLESVLHDLAARSEQIGSDGPWLVDSNRKTKRGAGKAYAPGEISPRLFCAAVAFEIVAHMTGRTPTSGNLEVGVVATDFWKLCDGRDKGWGKDKREGWDHYCADMDEYAVREVRERIRERIREIDGLARSTGSQFFTPQEAEFPSDLRG